MGRQSVLGKTALRLSERRLMLGIVDVLALNAALLVSLLNRPILDFSLGGLWQALPWFFLFSGLWLIVGFFFDLYDLAYAAIPFQSAWRAGGAAFFTSLVYTFIPLVTPGFPERRLIALVFVGLSVGLVVLWRLTYAAVFVQPPFQRRILVVGAGWSGRTIIQAITEAESHPTVDAGAIGYKILGFIDDDPDKLGARIEGVPVLGDRHTLVDLVRLLKPEELVIAISPSGFIYPELFQAILDCHEMGIHITPMTNLYEALTGRVPVEHAGRNIQVVLPMEQPAGYRLYLAVRRLFDLLSAVAGCLLVALLMPLAWLVNRLTAPGDIFFRQARVGAGGQVFHIVKFRTMIMDAEKDTGAVWAIEGDPRVTPLGRFLRRTRLDELPQFWNVLKGEMSLIGPRPERPEFVAELSQQIPFYRVRHAVKPGITGWAQVRYRYGASLEDALIKLQYDLYYTRNRGFYLDALILFKTIQVMLGMYGR